ncbi:MAG: hypothetical protein CM1200mP37_8110 [Chloroflexota bacterium]|nr:MAG: hypothetical protein CM1200mP37_8110 [Chloroflexota bacterium]
MLREAYTINDKLERKERISEIKNEIIETITNEEDPKWSSAEIAGSIEKLESDIVRGSFYLGRIVLMVVMLNNSPN